MPEGNSSAGHRAWATTEIRRNACKEWGQKGTLVVRFDSRDAETELGNRYQAERVKYCMRHKRDNIPMYLRTGEKPPRELGKEIRSLRIRNLLRI